MDDPRRKAGSCSVAQSAPHQVLVCMSCKHKGDVCKPGFALLKQLRAAVDAAGLGATFEISGNANCPDCGPDHGEPCVLAYRVTAKATWLFGDIDPDQPLDDLVDYARACAAQDDGWMNRPDLPLRQSDTTPARIPAAMIVTREGAIQ